MQRIMVLIPVVWLFVPTAAVGQTTRPEIHERELLRLIRDLKDQEIETHVPRLGYDAGGNVVYVALTADRATDGNVRLLPEFAHLSRVWIHCPRKPISPEAFGSVSKVEHLEELRLDDMFLDLSGKSYGNTIAKIETLRSLGITWSRVDREFLSALTRLPRLTRLSIRSTKTLDDSDVGILRDSQRLKVLDLGSTAVTDRCLNTLAGFASLKTLTVDLTAISDAAVRQSKLIGRVKVIGASRKPEPPL